MYPDIRAIAFFSIALGKSIQVSILDTAIGGDAAENGPSKVESKI